MNTVIIIINEGVAKTVVTYHARAHTHAHAHAHARTRTHTHTHTRES